MITKENLFKSIMEFIKITYNCYVNTNYTEDRIAYQNDITLCSSWLIEIDNKTSISKIIESIMDSSTSKHILDYYKGGKYGEIQAEAFTKLKNEIMEQSLNS